MASISVPLSTLAIAGAGVMAAGQLEAGQATANAANYQAQVARNNAAYASAAGSTQAENESLKQAQVGGLIRAGFGANNIDVNDPKSSAVAVEKSQRVLGNVSAATVENNALLQAYGYEANANLYTAEAEQATIGSYFEAGGSLLEGASQALEVWNNAPTPPADTQTN